MDGVYCERSILVGEGQRSSETSQGVEVKQGTHWMNLDLGLERISYGKKKTNHGTTLHGKEISM